VVQLAYMCFSRLPLGQTEVPPPEVMTLEGWKSYIQRTKVLAQRTRAGCRRSPQMPRVRPAPFGRASSLRLLGEILQFLLLGLRAAQAPAPLLCAGWKRRLASRGALTCSSTAQRQRLQGSSGCVICAATVTAVAVTYKRGCSPCVHCVHAWDAAQSKSLCPAASELAERGNAKACQLHCQWGSQRSSRGRGATSGDQGPMPNQTAFFLYETFSVSLL
jgi:hypothetical protein